jgi:hypothetical protein
VDSGSCVVPFSKSLVTGKSVTARLKKLFTLSRILLEVVGATEEAFGNEAVDWAEAT